MLSCLWCVTLFLRPHMQPTMSRWVMTIDNPPTQKVVQRSHTTNYVCHMLCVSNDYIYNFHLISHNFFNLYLLIGLSSHMMLPSVSWVLPRVLLQSHWLLLCMGIVSYKLWQSHQHQSLPPPPSRCLKPHLYIDDKVQEGHEDNTVDSPSS